MITPKSDQLPLKRFLLKTKLNAKVNWGVELSDFNIKFKFIKGVKNMPAATLCTFINLELTEPSPPEKKAMNMDMPW